MSALSDLVHGNFGNVGHDLSSDPWGTAAGVGAALATAAIPFTFGASAPLAAELGADAAGIGAADAAGAGGFLGFGDAAGAGGFGSLFGGGAEAAAGGTTAFDSLLTGGGGALSAAPEAAGGATGGLSGVDAAYGAGTGTSGTFGSTATEGMGAYNTVTSAAGGGDPLSTFNAPGMTGAGASGGTDWLGAAGSSLARNPLQTAGAVAAAGGLAYNMYAGQQTPPNVDAIRQQAQQLGTSGQALQSYLTTGTLPPALQASMDTATAAARARIISGYASRGLPTDPSQNSALAQELNNLQVQAVAAMAQTQTQLFNTGMQEVGMSAGLMQWLQTRDDKQSQQMGQAISNFAGALASMGSNRGGVTIQMPRAA